MTNPINQILFAQYKNFNQTFEAARFLNSEERSKAGQMLLGLKEEMEVNAHNATAFPDKIKTEDQFLQNLAAKISTLYNDGKGQSLSGLSKPTPTHPTQYVGFRNLSANCWVNALLQYLLHTPEGVAILHTVGQYYADGKDLDTARVPVCIKYCQSEATISNDRAVELFCSIYSGHQRLRALETLCRSKTNPRLIEHLMKFLPKIQREQLSKLSNDSSDLHTALNLLLANNEKAEENRLRESKRAGQYLLDAITAYSKALLDAEMRNATPLPIPSSISQNVRYTFHHFFGIQGEKTRPVFSISADAHEDAYEGLQNLMGRYEDILKAENTFPPKTYSETETRTRYEPYGAPRPLKNPRTQLETGNILRKLSFDYQILIDAGEKNGVCVEDLLDSYFQAPPILKPEDYPVFLSEDSLQEQTYRPVEQQKEFRDGAPQRFTLIIKRFAMGIDGRSKKLETRVQANRVITLPASVFPKDKCEKAYALESFFVHRGGSGFGHYIAYRKIDGKWVEFDDSKVRNVSDAEIDRILQGRVSATFTPYALDYRLVPEDKQKDMLAFSKQLRPFTGPTFVPDDNKGGMLPFAKQMPLPLPSAPPPPASEDNQRGTFPSAPLTLPVFSKDTITTSHDTVMNLLSKLLVLLKTPSCTEEEIAQVLTAVQKISPVCIKQLSTLVEIRDGVKASSSKDFLCKNAKKLVIPTVSWIRTSSDSILEQYIQREREKMPILACRAEIANGENMRKILPREFQSDIPSTLKTRQQEQNLTRQYRIANLRAFQALLKNESITNAQLNAVLDEFDLPAAIKDGMYAQIGELLGASKIDAQRTGREQFKENPRFLIIPMQKKFGKLSIDNGTSEHPSTTIIDQIIATL